MAVRCWQRPGGKAAADIIGNEFEMAREVKSGTDAQGMEEMMNKVTTANSTEVLSRYWHWLQRRRRRGTRGGIRGKSVDRRASTSSTKVLLTPLEASRKMVPTGRGASCH